MTESRPAPRLRFAPSPTGYFHVGGARTALFNWLVARQQHGTFVLRIEDTDEERNRPEWTAGILEAMRWLGLDWDELHHQSDRLDIYRAAGEGLWKTGAAYYCDCTREQVEERAKDKATPGYDSFCADRGLEPGPGRALRFRVPEDGATTVHDVIRGEPTFEHATIEDFVLFRGDGSPLFLVANVVDDIDMGITHVVRGEEHLPNTPKYILLWHALGGGALPVFAHLPVLVNEKRQKLSKRRDPVALEGYRDEGYLPEAMVNYLGLLGWAPPSGAEIVTLDEMIRDFRLEDVNNSPAFFDVQKLRHFNGEYIRALTVEQFIGAAGPFLARGPWAPGDFDFEVFERMAPLVQERVAVLSEAPAMVDFLFLPEPAVDEASWQKGMKGPAAGILDDAIAAYGGCEWTAAVLHDVTAAVGEKHGLKLGKAQAPIRVAVTGRTVGPPLFESLEVLGRERTLERLRAARAKLG